MPTCDLEEHPAIYLADLSIEVAHHVIDHLCPLSLRQICFVGLQSLAFQPLNVIGRDNIFVIVVYDVSLARQELSLVNEARDAVHLDQILDILLQTEALSRNLKLSVAV